MVIEEEVVAEGPLVKVVRFIELIGEQVGEYVQLIDRVLFLIWLDFVLVVVMSLNEMIIVWANYIHHLFF